MGAIGVDLGRSAVKLLQVRSGSGGLRVVGAGRIERPRQVESDEDWTPTANQVVAALAAGGFRGRRCVVSLPRSEIRTQAVRLPRMSERDLAQAVRWEAASRFGLEREAMEVDYLLTGAALTGTEERDELLLVAASHAAQDRCLEPLLSAGLRPVAVEADFSGLARAVTAQARRDDDRATVRAVVEIGASGSSIMILRGPQVAFYKPLGLRGIDLNRAVTDHLQIAAAGAADLRAARIAAACGSPRPGSVPLDATTERAVFEAVRPLLNEVVKEVVLCLRYYGVTFRGHPPATITLAGGDGHEPQLDHLLEQACKIRVVTDDPRDTLRGLMGPVAARLGRHPGPHTAWATAAGLSLRGFAARASRERTESARREAA
jgi:type IV pilus assembly protein PilM